MATLAKFNTRVQLKFDTLASWNALEKESFIPLKGEVCVVQVPTDSSVEQVTPPAYLIRVGDGVTYFENLPWLSALAADVYAWAKYDAAKFARWATNSPAEGETFTNSPELATTAELETAISGVVGQIQTAVNTTVPGLIDTAIDTLGNSLTSTGSTTKTITGITYNAETNTATVTYGDIAFPAAATVDTAMSDTSTNAVQNKVIKAYVDSNITSINNKIANAMHFLGITTTVVKDGDTTSSLEGIVVESLTAGAVIIAPISDEDDAEKYEYVWTGEAWELLGQEGSFAIKGSIMDADVAAAAAIAQTKIGASLEDNATLAEDITDLNAAIVALDKRVEEDESDMAGMWKSTILNVVENSSAIAAATHSNIVIGDKTMNYIVFDCGTSSLNI